MRSTSIAAEIEGESGSSEVPKGAEGPVDEAALEDINFDDSDMTNLHNHAWKNAKEAIELAKNRAAQFDTQAALERKTNEALALAKAQAHVRDDDEFVEGGEKGGKGIVDREFLVFLLLSCCCFSVRHRLINIDLCVCFRS